MVHDVDRMPRDFLDQHWLAPEASVRIGGNSGSRGTGQSDDDYT